VFTPLRWLLPDLVYLYLFSNLVPLRHSPPRASREGFPVSPLGNGIGLGSPGRAAMHGRSASTRVESKGSQNTIHTGRFKKFIVLMMMTWQYLARRGQR